MSNTKKSKDKIEIKIVIDMPEGNNHKSEMKDGDKVKGKKIFDILKESFKKKSIKWAKDIEWQSPTMIKLSAIDFTNEDKWNASKDTGKVDKTKNKMDEQTFTKPIILVKGAGKLLVVIDGRHRLMAAKKAKLPILAYVGDATAIGDDVWKGASRKI